MLTLSDIVASIPGWFRRRAKRKAMRAVADDLDRSPDDMLSDIGVSHDEIMCAFRNRRNPNARNREA